MKLTKPLGSELETPDIGLREQLAEWSTVYLVHVVCYGTDTCPIVPKYARYTVASVSHHLTGQDVEALSVTRPPRLIDFSS